MTSFSHVFVVHRTDFDHHPLYKSHTCDGVYVFSTWKEALRKALEVSQKRDNENEEEGEEEEEGEAFLRRAEGRTHSIRERKEEADALTSDIDELFNSEEVEQKDEREEGEGEVEAHEKNDGERDSTTERLKRKSEQPTKKLTKKKKACTEQEIIEQAVDFVRARAKHLRQVSLTLFLSLSFSL